MKRFLSYTSIALIAFIFSSCGSDQPKDEVVYEDMFEHLTDQVIVPRFDHLQSQLSALEADFVAFEPNQVQTLEALQQQFKSTYIAWQAVSSFDFGPAAEYSVLLRTNCNNFPADVAKIEANIESESYDLDFPSNYVAKGFPAIDYLLFHDNQSELLTELSDSSTLAYAKSCLEDVQKRVDDVVTGWDTYRSEFLSAKGNDRNSSLSLFFNSFLYDYEQLKRNKLALPAGFATKYGFPEPLDTSKVEGLYSGISFELMEANLLALQNIYLGVGENGVDGVGIYEKLKEYNAQSTVVDGDLAVAIETQFDLCKQALLQHTNDLPYEIVNNNNQLQETSTVFQKMVPMIKNDMRSYLSVTVTATDADGD